MANMKPPFPRLQRSSQLAYGLLYAAPFYEGSGLSVYDVANSNHGTWGGTGAKWGGGPSGWAGSFTAASTDYVAVTNDPSLNLVGDCTITATIRTGSAASSIYILSKQKTTANYNGYSLFVSSAGGVIKAEISDGTLTTLTGTKAVDDGVRHRIVFTRVGATGTLYIDGALDTSGTVRSGDMTFAVNLNIGRFTGATNYFNGLIEDVRLYNRAWSAAEVQVDAVEPWSIYLPPSFEPGWIAPVSTGDAERRIMRGVMRGTMRGAA